MLEHQVITVDELEALRLADYLGLSHEEAARHLKVSRPTVTRMLARAHQAIADALVHGKAIRIEGGDYTLKEEGHHCPNCGSLWPTDSQVCQKCHFTQGEEASP